MGSDRDLFEIYELVDPSVDHAAVERAARPPSRWQGFDPLTRRLSVVAAAIALVALVLAWTAIRARHPVHEKITRVAAAASAPAVDALGCPNVSACVVQHLPDDYTDIVTGEFPGTEVVTGLQTINAQDYSRIYRRELVVTSSQLDVRVIAQCRPGAAQVQGSPVAVYYYPTPGGRPVFVEAGQQAPPGVRYLSATVAGAAGCSLVVDVRADLTGNTVHGLPLDFLVRDLIGIPDLMITP